MPPASTLPGSATLSSQLASFTTGGFQVQLWGSAPVLVAARFLVTQWAVVLTFGKPISLVCVCVRAFVYLRTAEAVSQSARLSVCGRALLWWWPRGFWVPNGPLFSPSASPSSWYGVGAELQCSKERACLFAVSKARGCVLFAVGRMSSVNVRPWSECLILRYGRGSEI